MTQITALVFQEDKQYKLEQFVNDFIIWKHLQL